MWRTKEILRAVVTIWAIVGTILVNTPQNAQAESTNELPLIISQLKITSSNGQFITLFNSGDNAIDMSRYQLEYFNNYDLSKATSSRLIALSGVVAPHGYFMISDDNQLLCYQMTVDSVSLGLSSTAGLIQVIRLNQTVSGGAIMPVVEDSAGWSKTSANGVQTLPGNVEAFLHRNLIDRSWLQVQRDPANPCKLVSSLNGASTLAPGYENSLLISGTEPPSTILSNNDNGQSQIISLGSTGIPASDIGLMAPKITELMPNPLGSGNDTTSEYIELYNPNPVTFDLSGFILQTGTTSLHNYKFPAGTTIEPLSFMAVYSAQSRLSLSNTSGQAKLLDPLGNSISTVAPYTNAKDGQSWSLADGKWFWTTSATPNLANIIKAPPASTKTKSTTAKSSKSKSKTTKKAKQPKIKAQTKSSGGFLDTSEVAPIHFTALALVGAVALLYVAYEYRADIANHYYKLRSNFKTRFRDRA